MSGGKLDRHETLVCAEIDLEACLHVLSGIVMQGCYVTALSTAFDWRETAQGHDYWQKQNERTLGGKPLTKRARRIIINTILERYGDEH